MNSIFIAILLSLSPISELRGGIIYAIASGINPGIAFFVCVLANLLVAPLLLLFLSTLHKSLYKTQLYKRFFNSYINRIDKKVQSYEKRHKVWGFLALTVFVAIPLPMTGAWTGALIAWILGLNRKKSILAISIGVMIAGIIVTALTLSGLAGFAFVNSKL